MEKFSIGVAIISGIYFSIVFWIFTIVGKFTSFRNDPLIKVDMCNIHIIHIICEKGNNILPSYLRKVLRVSKRYFLNKK